MNICIYLKSDVGLQISDNELCFGDAFLFAESLTFVPYGRMLFHEIGLKPTRGEFRSCPGLLKLGGMEVAKATDNLMDSAGSPLTGMVHDLTTAAIFSSMVRDQNYGATLEDRVAEHGGLAIERCSIKSIEARGGACILVGIESSPPWFFYALDCDPGERYRAGEWLKAVFEPWVGGKIQAQQRADLSGVNVGVLFKHFVQRLEAVSGLKSGQKTSALPLDFVERMQRDSGFEKKVIRALLEATSDGSTMAENQWPKLEPDLWAFYVSRIKGCYLGPKGEQPPEYAGVLQTLVKKKFHKRREELRRWADSLDPEIYPAICAHATDDWIGLLFAVMFFIVIWLAIVVWCLLSMRAEHEGSEGYIAAIRISGLILLIPAGIMALMAWKGRRHCQSLSRTTAEKEVKTKVDDGIAPHVSEEHSEVSTGPTGTSAPTEIYEMKRFTCTTCGQEWASNYCPECCHRIDRSADAKTASGADASSGFKQMMSAASARAIAGRKKRLTARFVGVATGLVATAIALSQILPMIPSEGELLPGHFALLLGGLSGAFAGGYFLGTMFFPKEPPDKEQDA